MTVVAPEVRSVVEICCPLELNVSVFPAMSVIEYVVVDPEVLTARSLEVSGDVYRPEELVEYAALNPPGHGM